MTRRDFGATSGTERPGRLALIGLLVVPLLTGGLLAWALATPAAHLERITAAIVNDDEPVTIDGKTVPLGRQFAAGLLAAQEPAQPDRVPGPTPTPTPTATAGALPSASTGSTPTPSAGPGGVSTTGVGAATPSFTWVLTNSAEAATGLASGRYAAVLTIPKSFSADATSYSGAAQEARQAKLSVKTTPASAWLDPTLVAAVSDEATATLNRQLTEGYLKNVYQGFNTLNEQIGTAADGAAQVSSGASAANSGAQEVSSGASDLSTGLAAVATGAASLSSGLNTLATSSARLPSDTASLASGSARVSSGVSQIASGLDAATARLADVVARVCVTPGPACRAASTAYDAVRAVASQTDQLATGAADVAQGNSALSQAMTPLVSGIDSAASGSAQVSSGASRSSAGATSLASGASQVASGTAQVSQGAQQLSGGLDQAVTQIPTYSTDDIDVLTSVVSQPVTVAQETIGSGLQSAPLFTALALWIGGFAVALAFQAVPPRRLLSSASSGSIAGRAVLPGILLGAAQGAIVGVAVLGSVSATPGQWLAFTGSALFVGVVSTLVNLGLAAAFGGVGRLIAIAMFLLSMSAGLSGTVPPVIAALAAPLPSTQALGLLRSTLTGDVLGAWGATAILILYALAAFALVFAGVASRRSVRVRAIAD